MYHVQYQPPPSAEVASRLTEEPGGVLAMKQALSLYHRHSTALLNCYTATSKSFNVDQPLGDIFEEGKTEIYLAVLIQPQNVGMLYIK